MQNNAQGTERSGGLAYKWIVAWVVIIGVFMSILDSTIVNIAIPRLQTAFGADLHSVQWVLTAYILTLGVVTPTSGFLADRFGIKRSYLVSLGLFTIGSALCGLSWSLPVLIFFRVLQGIGGASLFPLSITLLFREFPPQERGIAMGSFGVPALLAPALGPTLGGYIVTYADWQWIFFINVPIGFIAILLATSLLRETRAETGIRFDILGFIFSAAGFACVLYALAQASTDGWGSMTVLGFLIIGLFALCIFVAVELIIANQGGHPLLDLRVFRNLPFTTSTIANLFVIFGLFGGLFLLPVYLQILRQQSAFQAGLILLPQALASMVSVVVGGRLVDKIGVRPVVIPGLIVLSIVTWLLAHITLYTPLGQLQILLILRGLGFGLVAQPLIVSALSEIPPHQLAQASSINTLNRSVSSSLGIAVLATLVQAQTQVHYAHLAEQVTASSPLGMMLPRLQALLIAQGGNPATAYQTAVLYIARLLQAQGYMLAIQDAFLLSLATIPLAIIATLFVRGSRPKAKTAEVPAQEVPAGAREESLVSL